MARRQQTRGSCTYCGREMAKGGMARHLATCPQRLAVQARPQRGRPRTLYHLQVEDAGSGEYWLHLEMNGDATLQTLDDYLRTIWLECCGHLSAFEIGPWRYTQLFEDRWENEKSMRVRVDKLFHPGMKIAYEYDFGTTSYLTIKVVAQRQGWPTAAHPIALMARNRFDPPPCMECGRPASRLCVQCLTERSDGVFGLCAEHALSHPHEDYGPPMALVNSPRTGMCGYDGPAEPPPGSVSEAA